MRSYLSLILSILWVNACEAVLKPRTMFTKREIAATIAATFTLFPIQFDLVPVVSAAAATELICNGMLLNLDYIGQGGSASVYKAIDKNSGEIYVAKVSRLLSTPSVRKEARLLEYLNAKGVPNVEEFVGSCHEKLVGVHQNAMFVALYKPFFNPPEVSSIAAMDTHQQQEITKQLFTAVTKILRANVAITDLQMLAEPREGGKLLLIDLTEASLLDEVQEEQRIPLVESFLNEAIAFVTEATATTSRVGEVLLREAAKEGLEEGLKGGNVSLPPLSSQVESLVRGAIQRI